MADDKITHYVAQVVIEKVVRTPEKVNRSTSDVSELGKRRVTEVTKIVVKDSSLLSLINKTTKHLDLIDDNEEVED